jgi:hypothetical protein
MGIRILQAIGKLGGSACLQQIYAQIENDEPLSSEHLRTTNHGGRPAYQHQVRSHVSNMCQNGDLSWIKRGCYSLTPRGQQRIG